jgi:hypothetical protein
MDCLFEFTAPKRSLCAMSGRNLLTGFDSNEQLLRITRHSHRSISRAPDANRAIRQELAHVENWQWRCNLFQKGRI